VPGIEIDPRPFSILSTSSDELNCGRFEHQRTRTTYSQATFLHGAYRSRKEGYQQDKARETAAPTPLSTR
jgi:hypothetical protein